MAAPPAFPVARLRSGTVAQIPPPRTATAARPTNGGDHRRLRRPRAPLQGECTGARGAAATRSAPDAGPPPRASAAAAAGGWRCRRWAALLIPVLVTALMAVATTPTATAAKPPAVLVPITTGVGVPPGAPVAPGAKDDGAHAVPGNGYTVTDLDGTGAAAVTLDGSGSHTHNGGDEGAPTAPGELGPESGYGGVVAMTWSVMSSGVVIGTGPRPRVVFPVGTTSVLLTVKDWTGDVHAASTTVVVRGDTSPGLWCYYTPAGAVGGKATHASLATAIQFFNAQSFGAPFARGTGGWTARCVGSYLAKTTGGVSFGVFAEGGTATLSVRRLKVPLKSLGSGIVWRMGKVTLPAGLHPIELTFTRPAGVKKMPRLTLNVPAAQLSHQNRKLLPTLTAVTPSKGDLAGGSRIVLRGTALSRALGVRFGGVAAEVVVEPLSRSQQQASTATSVTVVVPRGVAPGPAPVVVVTPTGESNPVPYTYTASQLPPEVIAWRTTTLRTADGASDFPLRSATSAALGPDLKLYVGCAAGGQLYRLTVDWLTHRVMSSCSTWLGGQVLGVSFNPVDVGRTLPRVYVSVGNLSPGAPWTGGSVLRLTSLSSPGGCFSKPTTVVSGLPVQVGHDHSIGRPAYTETGDMLLPVGGITNNGIPHPASGSLDESPLSAAIVKVPLSKPGFDGRIRYSTNNASTARVIGGDVTVWASGIRNGLFLERHSVSGTYWILDNGPNLGYGDVSRTCSVTTPMDPDAPYATRRDKLLRVTPGGYYGHPNRNRGRDDPRQCTYRLPFEQAAGYTKSLADFEPSSNGIAEMRVNLYRGALKGHFFFSRFASGGDGLLTAVNVLPSGALAGGAKSIRTVKHFSGLSVTVSPYGSLVMPRVRQGHAAVLIPIYKRTPDAGPLVLSVTPNRGPRRGGYRVWVAAYHWGTPSPPVVKVGNKPCTNVVVGKGGLTCTIPAGRGKLAVFVNGIKGGTGHDFEYLDV